MVKKIAIALGALLFLFVVAAIVIPLVVDVNKYRPQIVEAVNQRIDGKFELGELSLSLWGQVRVDIEGLKLLDSQGRSIVAVEDAYLHIPFVSLLSGSPVVTLRMEKPAVNVVKNKSGEYNIMNVMKDTPPEQSEQAQTGTAQPPAEADSDVTIPAIAANARLGMEMKDALVTYKDQTQDLDTKISDFNLIVKDLSLSRPTDIEAWANLDTRVGKTMHVKGPVKFNAEAKTDLSGGKLKDITTEARLNLDDLVIDMPGLFHKPKGVAANLETVLRVSPEQANIEKLEAKFLNAVIRATGKVDQISTTSGPSTPVVNMKIDSNEIDLAAWDELVPMLKEYDLGGKAGFNAEVRGPVDKLNYEAKLRVDDMTAKAPMLKAQPKFDALVDVKTDKVESLLLTMEAPESQLKVEGTVTSFTRPLVKLNITSPGMNLDKLIDFEAMAAAEQAAAPAKATQAAQATGTPQAPKSVAQAEEDLDKLLDPLRENPVAAAMVVDADVKIDSLKAYDILMKDLLSKITMRDLSATVNQFSMKLWDGKVTASATSELRPKTPTYRFNADADDVDLKQAANSQAPLFKNTIYGLADFKMEGTGSSFNPEPAKKNLKAKGNMRIENAVFATIDVAAMAKEGVNEALAGLADKVPALKGKLKGNTVKATVDKKSEYALISSNFTIDNGKFTAPDFTARAKPNQGVDLKGDTTLGLIDYKLDAEWEVIDTYNVLKVRDLSVEQNGIKVEKILARGQGPVSFPVTVGCTVFEPCYKYTEVAEHFAKIALANLSGGVKAKAQAELDQAKAKARQQAEQKAKEALKSPKAKEKLKGLGKKLFGK